MENNTRINESCYSSLERLPERAETDSFNIKCQAPLEALEGSTPDISPLLHFSFWDPVYYRLDDSDFPSDSTEWRGHWVGTAENVGHAMTYRILTNDTKKVIYRLNVRSCTYQRGS